MFPGILGSEGSVLLLQHPDEHWDDCAADLTRLLWDLLGNLERLGPLPVPWMPWTSAEIEICLKHQV